MEFHLIMELYKKWFLFHQKIRCNFYNIIVQYHTQNPNEDAI